VHFKRLKKSPEQYPAWDRWSKDNIVRMRFSCIRSL